MCTTTVVSSLCLVNSVGTDRLLLEEELRYRYPTRFTNNFLSYNTGENRARWINTNPWCTRAGYYRNAQPTLSAARHSDVNLLVQWNPPSFHGIPRRKISMNRKNFHRDDRDAYPHVTATPVAQLKRIKFCLWTKTKKSERYFCLCPHWYYPSSQRRNWVGSTQGCDKILHPSFKSDNSKAIFFHADDPNVM